MPAAKAVSCRASQAGADEADRFGGQFQIFRRCAAKAAMRHRFEDVQLNRYPARSSARCMRTVFERNRSRVPDCRNVGGKPAVKSPNSGER